MKRFTHINAKNLEHAVACLQEYKDSSYVIGGGSDLMGCLKDKIWMEYPQAIVNLKTIENLSYIREEANKLHIGALTTLTTIAESALVQKYAPALAKAAKNTGSPLLQNIGTLAGNICQQNRCWYYRYPNKLGGRIDCVRKGGTKCLAIPGEHRYHSIFGAIDKCIAVNPSDTAPALMVLDASVKTTKRTLNIDSFFSASHGAGSTVLDRDEIVVSIIVPIKSGKSSFKKIAFRKSIDFALVNCAIAIHENSGKIETARICLNGVYNIPLRFPEAEEMLMGKTITETLANEVAELALSNAKPLFQNIYKVKLAKTIIADTLLTFLEKV